MMKQQKRQTSPEIPKQVIPPNPQQFFEEFDPTPDSRILGKVCYFYQPYSKQLGFPKVMEFEDHSICNLQHHIKNTLH